MKLGLAELGCVEIELSLCLNFVSKFYQMLVDEIYLDLLCADFYKFKQF